MLVFRPQTGANSNRTPSPKADYMFWFHSAIHLRIWILDNATHPGLRGRGVSHHQTSSIQGVSHCQIGYPLNPVYPWFTYRGRLAQNLKESIQKRSNLFCPLLFVLASQRAPDAAFGGNKKSVGNILPTLYPVICRNYSALGSSTAGASATGASATGASATGASASSAFLPPRPRRVLLAFLALGSFNIFSL